MMWEVIIVLASCHLSLQEIPTGPDGRSVGEEESSKQEEESIATDTQGM